MKAKDWDGALRTIDDLIKGATADSYDQAILERTIAQVETQKGDYPAATEPLEKSLGPPRSKTRLFWFWPDLSRP